MGGLYLIDQSGRNLRLEKVCDAMMDAVWMAANALDEIFRQAAATRQPDVETPIHKGDDGLATDESRSSGDEDALSHGVEPDAT